MAVPNQDEDPSRESGQNVMPWWMGKTIEDFKPANEKKGYYDPLELSKKEEDMMRYQYLRLAKRGDNFLRLARMSGSRSLRNRDLLRLAKKDGGNFLRLAREDNGNFLRMAREEENSDLFQNVHQDMSGENDFQQLVKKGNMDFLRLAKKDNYMRISKKEDQTPKST